MKQELDHLKANVEWNKIELRKCDEEEIGEEGEKNEMDICEERITGTV